MNLKNKWAKCLGMIVLAAGVAVAGANRARRDADITPALIPNRDETDWQSYRSPIRDIRKVEKQKQNSEHWTKRQAMEMGNRSGADRG